MSAYADNRTVVISVSAQKAGEILPVSPDREAGAQVIELVVDSFMSSTGPNQTGIVMKQDAAEIHIVFRRYIGPSRGIERVLTRVYDVEVVDEKGRIYQSDQKGKFRFQGLQYSSAENKLRSQLSEDKDVARINVYLDPLFRPRHELGLRGKISVDEGWPIPFEVALTPNA